MKKSYKIYIIMMFVIMAVPGILVLILPSRDYSANENRYLEKLPKVQFDEILTGDFQDKVSNAFSDQFIVRDFMMGVSTAAKRIAGFKDSDGVYFAKDDYYITKITDYDLDKNVFIQNLMYVGYFAKKQKSEVYTMLVPSTGTIFKEKLPSYAPFYDSSAMYNAANTLLEESDLIDVREILSQQASATQLYFKTDHHWTLQGAYAAYSEYCFETGLQKHSYGSFNPGKVSSDFYGTLYSKVLDFSAEPDELYAVSTEASDNVKVVCDGEEKKGIYDKEMLDKKDKYAYFFGGNYGRVDIETGSSSKLKLLVIKDSFANSFVPFILDDYSKITMIDPRYYGESIIENASSGDYDHILILYEMSNFAQDNNLYKLTK